MADRSGGEDTYKLRRSDGDGLRRQFAAYLCRRWNVRHDDDLLGLVLYHVEEPTRLGGPDQTRRAKLLEHSCRDATVGA